MKNVSLNLKIHQTKYIIVARGEWFLEVCNGREKGDEQSALK